jgi:LuxR family maltose regulon positive regulatory protein
VISEQFPEEDFLTFVPVLLAHVRQRRGEVESAQAQLRWLAAQPLQPNIRRQLLANQARLALETGDLASAQRWLAAADRDTGAVSAIQEEQEALLCARILLASGEAGEVVQQLEGRLADAQAQGRGKSELEIQLLTALAQYTLGSLERARQPLIEALTLAQPENYQRIFLDEGRSMAALLRETLPDLKEGPLLAYARALLYSINQELAGSNTVPSGGLESPDEPLSDQELRVLRLLAAGLSNPEIAGELIVSINTIKTHVKSIYRKLNVNSRKEAREAARQLKLV